MDSRHFVRSLSTLSLVFTFHAASGVVRGQAPDVTDAPPAVATSGPAVDTYSDAAKPGAAKSDPSKGTVGSAKATADRAALESEEAVGRFGQILARRPLHGPAFAGLVKHFADRGKLSDLVKDYEKRVAALPDDAATKIVLARIYLRAGQAEKAAEIIDKIDAPPTTSRDDVSKLLVFKSEVYQQTGKIDEAQKMLDSAYQQARTVSERLKLAEAMADLHMRANAPEKATEALTRLAAEYPDSYLHRKRIADALAQRGLNEAAVKEYRAILGLTADQPDKRCEVLRQLGGTLEKLEKRQEAIDAYSEAVNLLSGDHWMLRELHERIVTLYRATGRLEDLVEYCRKQIERSPEQTSMRILLADVLAATDKMDDAKKTLEDAVGLFPKDRALSERRVQFLEKAGDSAGVAAEYERIIAQTPNEIELYINYGQFLASNKQLDAARNQWKHVLNREVTDATLANRLGAMFEPYELYDDAVECYERAITLAPTRPESYTSLSRLWFYRGEKEKAVEALRRMAKANPEDAGIHATLCQSLMNFSLADEALAAITKACELAPKQVSYALARADVLLNLGRVDESMAIRRDALGMIRNPGQLATAIDVLVSMHATSRQLETLKKMEIARLETEPTNTTSLMLLARAADYEREFGDARKWLKRLIETDPSHEEARRQLAKLYEAVGDVDAAVKAYKTLGEANPSHARQYYQAIADLKLRYSDKAGAIDTFERMVQASPGNATVLKAVAEQLVRLEEYEKAIALYEQALRISQDSPEVRLAYGKALQAAGRLEESMPAYKAAAMQRTDRDSAVEAMNRLHEVAGQLGTIDDLVQEFQAHIESNPEDTQTARMLAELLIREYEYNRAMEMIDLVLRASPRDVELPLIRGEILRRLSRFDEAVESYRSVLRRVDVDRDFVLGEMGKAYLEGGRIDQAKAVWKQINHKLYAGSLLRNNGLIDDAVEVLREGIRMKPDDFGLHRNLVGALEAAGKTDEALDAAKRLLDLEPDNVFNIMQVAKAYLDRGNRAGAAEIAARLFSAGVGEKKDKSNAGTGGGSNSWSGTPLWMMSMQSAWWGGRGGSAKSNLERAVEFYQSNGLLAELEEALTQQLDAQPENAILREQTAMLFSETFGKPEKALELYRDLETATFPLERQNWLGQCSQRDFMRVRQYQLIGSKPGLRDKRLADLEPKGVDALSRDELVELAVIRQSQGATDAAVDLLERVAKQDDTDVVALSVLADTLMRAERFTAAEPHVRRLLEILTKEQARVEAEMLDRVRRDYVRTLPVQFQLRVSEDLLRDIAKKWTLGQSIVGDFTGFVQTMGLSRARVTLGTILAKTNRMEEAREIWKTLEPTNAADADGWTMLAGIAQLHEQIDVAYAYYENALQAAKVLAADPLLQQIYGGSMSSSWFGGEEVIDTAFNKIVEAFASKDKLVELYDFLRETDQTSKAKRVAEQYELYDKLKEIHTARLSAAREAFKQASDDPINQSVPYFTEVCKLAELHDQTGGWPAALKIYEDYLADFPDEMGLITTLGEVSEKQEEYGEAVEWEKKLIAAKERLQRKAREWAMRSLYMTPAAPQIIASDTNRWDWPSRWGKSNYWGGQNKQMELWPSWMRISQLYLSLENNIASADAMERAIGAAGGDRQEVGTQVLSLIRSRHLEKEMLPVLRSLAVYLPTDEPIQLAFAESLEMNEKSAVAQEVYQRMLRRGVSDIGVLARVREKLSGRKVAGAAGEGEGAFDTLASLEKAVEADPDNANNRLRLAKAYYYSLDLDKALESLQILEKTAPHLEGLHDLLVEIYTIRGDTDALIAALATKINRTKDESAKRATRSRLVEELLAAGKTEEALKELMDVVDSRDPNSYERVGMLLHYFGRHDEAVKQFELAARSQTKGGWGNQDSGKTAIARAMVLKGDIPAAAGQIMESIEEQARQSNQYYGMAGMYGGFNDNESNVFEPFVAMFVMRPALLDEVEKRLLAKHEANPDDPQTTKQLMQLFKRVGRRDQAEAILETLTTKAASDQSLVIQMIDRAIKRRKYDLAIELVTKAIEQMPKPTLPPGIPAQYAGMMMLMSARNQMLCKLGDIYWKQDEKEKAFEQYKRIIDEKVDESKLAYAAICMLRGRTEESREIVTKALEGQKVKSPMLLQFSALLTAVDGDLGAAFDQLAEAIEAGTAQDDPFGMGGGGASPSMLAQLAVKGDQLERFEKFMDKRIRKNPNEWSDHELLAQTYFDLGRVEDAEKTLKRASKIKALRRQATEKQLIWMEGYASDKTLIKNYRKVIKAAEKKVSPSRSSSLFGGYFGGGNDEGPADTTKFRNRLADLLWESGDIEGARTVWTERLNLESADSQIKLATKLEQKESFDEAEACYRKALQLQPDSQRAHRALLALSYYKRDDMDARDHLREVFVRTNQEGKGSSPRRNARYGYGIPDNDDSGPEAQLNFWAKEISDSLNARSDAKIVTEPPTAEEVSNRKDGMLALAVLSGDWAHAEAMLGDRLKTEQYEPMLWTLWAGVQERKGDWAEAAKAWETVRRLAKTSLPNRRDQLKLVLAGKHIKDAAAGSRQSPAGGAAAMMMGGAQRSYSYSSLYGRYGYGGGSQDATTSTLGSLYVKLKEYDKAERLYLFSGQGQVQWVLPTISSLMWTQGAKERAVELTELSVILASEDEHVPQYAGLLAEMGRIDQAVELLVRAYRCARVDDDNSYGYWAMFGGYGGNQDREFEDYRESSISSALYDILRRNDNLDATLSTLNQRADENPDDTRLAKLVLSMEIKDRRWDTAKGSLETWSKARPEDAAIKSKLLQACLQTGQWSAAEALLAEFKKEAKASTNPWSGHEAFIHLMNQDAAGAVEAIEPLLAKAPTAEESNLTQVATMVLLLAKQYDRLIEYYKMLETNRPLEDHEKSMIFAVQVMADHPVDAARLAMDELWRTTGVLDTSSNWYKAVARLAAKAKFDGKPLGIQSNRKEDGALLTLASDGAEAGMAAFAAIADAEPDNLNARRGLLMAAMAAGDWPRAVAANDELVAWLEPRRRAIWLPTPTPPLTKQAANMLESLQAKDMDVSSMMTVAMSLSQMLEQLLGASRWDGGPKESAAKYEALWTAQKAYGPELLARAGEAEALREALQAQAKLSSATLEDESNSRGYRTVTYRSGGGTTTYTYYNEGGESTPSAFVKDWKPAYRNALRSHRMFEPFLTEMEKLDRRVAPEAYDQMGESYATLGKLDQAKRWRSNLADALFVKLDATDKPAVSSEENQYGWWYYRYGRNGSAETDMLRTALTSAFIREPRGADDDGTDDEGGTDAFQTDLNGAPDELWELALLDDAVATRLTEREAQLGPGWEGTQTFSQLKDYYHARRDGKKVIELIEKVCDAERLPRSSLLSAYLNACFEAADYERVNQVLARSEAVSSTLENDVLLTRLLIARHQKDDQTAAEMEKTLLDRCRTEPKSPVKLEPELVTQLGQIGTDSSFSGYRPYNRFGMSGVRYQSYGVPRVSTVAQVANGLGVEYDSVVQPGDIQVNEIQYAYGRHRLFADAARMVDVQLAQSNGGLAADERMGLLQAKANYLSLADDADGARAILSEVASYWKAKASENPWDPSPHRALESIYGSKAWGRDFKKAYAEFKAAKQCDPTYDSEGTREAALLYKLDRHEEAWAMYKRMLAEGRLFAKDVQAAYSQYQGYRGGWNIAPTLYRAGLAGRKSGDTRMADGLIRQALWRDPTSSYAKEAREMIHD